MDLGRLPNSYSFFYELSFVIVFLKFGIRSILNLGLCLDDSSFFRTIFLYLSIRQ